MEKIRFFFLSVFSRALRDRVTRAATGHLLVGSVFIALLRTMSAEEIDPFETDLARPVEASSVKVVYEVFSLPLGQAAALQRSALSDPEFYQRLLSGLEDDTVTLETFLAVRGLAGTLMTASEGQDYRYPTEFDPPELPNQVTGPATRKTEDGREITVFPVTSSNPTAYQPQFLGKTLTAKVRFDRSDRLTLEIQTTRTTLVQKDVYGRGMAQVEYPRFAVPRIDTVVLTTSGKPFLLGTVSPPAEEQAQKGELITHFAFVTATRLDSKKQAIQKK